MSEKKAKLPKFLTPVGTAIYPKLTKPDTKFQADGEYSVKIAMDPSDERDALLDKLTEIRDTFHAKALADADPKQKKILGAYAVSDVGNVELDDAGEETGRIILNPKMRAIVRPEGKESWEQKPKLFDAANNVIDDPKVQIWGGSKLRAQFEAFGFVMPASKLFGVSLRLKAVQVIDLVSGDDSSPFSEHEGGFTATAGDGEDKPFEGADDDGSGDY